MDGFCLPRARRMPSATRCVHMCMCTYVRMQEACAAETPALFAANQAKIAKYNEALRHLHYTLLIGDAAYKITGRCVCLALNLINKQSREWGLRFAAFACIERGAFKRTPCAACTVTQHEHHQGVSEGAVSNLASLMHGALWLCRGWTPGAWCISLDLGAWRLIIISCCAWLHQVHGVM